MKLVRIFEMVFDVLPFLFAGLFMFFSFKGQLLHAFISFQLVIISALIPLLLMLRKKF